jgi:anti-sigma B factor antagonist
MAELTEGGGAEAAIAHGTDDAGNPVVRLSGEIDLSNAQSVRSAVEPIVGRAPAQVVFDLARLDFLDSSGLAVLLATAERVPVVLRNPKPIIQRLVESTGLTDILRMEP